METDKEPRALAVVRNDDTPSVERVIAQTTAIQQCMSAVMKVDEHYGTIPGTPKPSLWQAGADKLLLLFWLRPEFTTMDRTVTPELIMYEIKCTLKHRRTGEEWGEGMGACNSMEKKYSHQTKVKICPRCAMPAIIRGKEEYGGGWLCFKKKEGCGAKFLDDDTAITDQAGQTAAAGVADLQNTILKMAAKRAKVAAVLAATAASDIFTQDLEDLVEAGLLYSPPKVETPAPSPAAPAVTPGDAPAASSTGKAPPRKGIMRLADEILAGPEQPPEDLQDQEWVPDQDVFDPDTGELLGRGGGITSAQNKLIHKLRNDLGHHLDSVKPAERDAKGGIVKPAENVKHGKYYAKLREHFSKAHTNELTSAEASRAIKWLETVLAQKMARLNDGP
jgi:hypothetical protein